MTTPMHLTQFLSEAKTAELELGLSELAELGANNFMGIWDPQTLFCVVVEVMDGKPFQWHVRGPLNREGAKTWLSIVQAEITGGDERPRSMH